MALVAFDPGAHPRDSAQSLKSTGLHWDPPDILRRYGPLRKVAPALSFHLVYHPYLVVKVRGQAKGRWLPGRYVESVWAVDATGGATIRLLDFPEVVIDTLGPAPGRGVRVKSEPGGKELVLAGLEVFPARIEPQKAEEMAKDQALTAWQRQFRRPFGSGVAVRIIDVASTLVYKPFWIIIKSAPENASGKRPDPHAGREADNAPYSLMAVDATTGLAGMAEFRPVLAAWEAGVERRK